MRPALHCLRAAALLAALVLPAMGWGKSVALLVGVSQYPNWPNAQLDGPEHDVPALARVLQRRWGFAASDIKTLVNGQATRAAILAELQALRQRTQAGDEVLVYFSGHGTSAVDAGLAVPVPHGSGAFVPSDIRPDAPDLLGQLIVGRTDLVPVFTALEREGRRLWIISDSCYSGNQVRSVLAAAQGELPARTIPIAVGKEAARQRADFALAQGVTAPPPWPYQKAAFLSASAEGEKARDIPRAFLPRLPTIDGQPHGALTDALLRVLEGQIPADLNRDGLLSLAEVHRATSDFMAQRAYGHTPQRLPAVAEDSQGIGLTPVLAARGVAAQPRQASAEPLRVAFEGPVPPAVRQAVAAVADVTVGNTNPELILTEEQGRVAVLAASRDILAVPPAGRLDAITAQVQQLAWAKRLRLLAERHRRGALQLDMDPALMGGNFVLGSSMAFVVRPDKAATVLLLNISSDGLVSVLYPHHPSEAKPVPPQQATFIPGEEPERRIKVQEPLGMDFQFAFAFDAPPAELARWHRALNMSPSDPRLEALERTLQSMQGEFTFASSSMRTLKP